MQHFLTFPLPHIVKDLLFLAVDPLFLVYGSYNSKSLISMKKWSLAAESAYVVSVVGIKNLECLAKKTPQ